MNNDCDGVPDLVVIPVFRGGHLWRACLKSWEPLVDLIPEWLISINGRNGERDFAALVESTLFASIDVEVISSERDLSLPEHLAFIASNSVKLRKPTVSNVMFWSCDDTVKSSQFLKFFSNLSSSYKTNSCVFGDWDMSLRKARKVRQRSSLWSKFPGPRDVVLQAFRLREIQPDSSSSVTGVVAPRQAMLDSFIFLSASQGAVRIEFVLVSHRSVHRIMACEDSYALIHFHQNQNQVTVTQQAWNYDEFRYLIWLYNQGRLGEPAQFFYAAIKALKIIFTYPRILVLLVGDCKNRH